MKYLASLYFIASAEQDGMIGKFTSERLDDSIPNTLIILIISFSNNLKNFSPTWRCQRDQRYLICSCD